MMTVDCSEIGREYSKESKGISQEIISWGTNKKDDVKRILNDYNSPP